ncbi:hypothetical protein [Lactobacillus equicursoris]|uniref:hypothetical protein n=1 Tax=Lactobacillus equicursoris TaxID=420645 RepID=UPI00242E1352|nr:hypothetical protein [Lactobacillus equicursoris]MDD6385668.1 hypothetical protein [Lactobacillus equicursoris]
MQRKIKKAWDGLWPLLTVMLLTTIIIWPQLASKRVIIVRDAGFHFGRFYDAAMQIKTGHYSFFQTNYGFQQSGRVINALYGPLFAYFNGALLLLCNNWFTYQVVSIYLLCLVAAGSMLLLLHYSGVNKVVSVLISLIYLNIGLIPAFINASSFGGWGQALMPLVLLNGWRMVKDPKKPINWLWLGSTMGLLLQVHLLSALLACLLLAPFFLLALIKHKKVWKDFFKAVALAAVLGSNTLLALLWLSATNQLSSPDAYNLAVSGLKLVSQQTQLGNSYGQILPVFALLIAINFAGNLLLKQKGTAEMLLLAWSMALLLIASNYFPWGCVQKKLPFLATNFQFPFRLVTIIYPMLLLSVALTVQKVLTKKNLPIFAAVLAALLFLLARPVYQTNQLRTQKLSPKKLLQTKLARQGLDPLLSVLNYGGQADYLPVVKKGADIGKAYRKQIASRWQKFGHQVLPGGKQQLSWTSKGGKVILPLVAYQQSQVALNGKTVKKLTRKSGGFPVVEAKKGKNTAVLTFVIPLWGQVVIWGCWLSWLLLASFFLIKSLTLARNHVIFMFIKRQKTVGV